MIGRDAAYALAAFGALVFGLTGWFGFRSLSRAGRLIVTGGGAILGAVSGATLTVLAAMLAGVLEIALGSVSDTFLLIIAAVLLLMMPLSYIHWRAGRARRAEWRAARLAELLGPRAGPPSARSDTMRRAGSAAADVAPGSAGAELARHAEQVLAQQLAEGAIDKKTYARLLAELRRATGGG